MICFDRRVNRFWFTRLFFFPPDRLPGEELFQGGKEEAEHSCPFSFFLDKNDHCSLNALFIVAVAGVSVACP